MAELSLAASIAGLVSLAGQLYNTLDTFISNVRDAPALAQTIHSEINSFRNSLKALSDVLSNPSCPYNPQRGALISADYVVVSFTDAVLLFSQLENAVIPLASFTEFSITAKTQWARKKQKLNELVSRLQWQKHTLVLQLNILRCASDADAEQNRRVLDILIRERLAKDRDMERRIELCEERLRLTSSASTFDNDSIRSSATTDSDNLTIIPANTNNGDTPELAQTDTTGLNHDLPSREFEALLNASWVYRRNVNREENMSFRSSVIRQSAWSALSDISLANLSIITVMALPVQIQELADGHWYEMKQPDEETNQLGEAKSTYQIPPTPYLWPMNYSQRVLDQVIPDPAPGSQDTEKETPDSLQPTSTERTEKEQDSTIWEPVNDDEDVVYPCKGCGEILEEGKAFELAGNRWHIDCFRCSTCGTLLDSDANLLLLGDGSIICNNCTYSCHACTNKIEDLAILVGDLAYCSQCFRCRNCKRKIENLRYARTSQGIFCMSCHEALMARRRKMKRDGPPRPVDPKLERRLPPLPPSSDAAEKRMEKTWREVDGT